MQSEDHYGDYFRSLADTYGTLPPAELQALVDEQLEALREQLVEQGYPQADLDQEMALAIAAADAAFAAQVAPDEAASLPEPNHISDVAAASAQPPAAIPAFLVQNRADGRVQPAEAAIAAMPQPSDDKNPRPPRRTFQFPAVSRPLFLALVAFLAVYATVLTSFLREGHPSLVVKGVETRAAGLDVQFIGVDLTRDVLTLAVLPDLDSSELAARGRLTHDLAVELDTGTNILTHTFKSGEVPVPWQAIVPIELGDQMEYPLDHYAGDFHVKVAVDGGSAIAPNLALDKVAHGFRMTAEATGDATGLNVSWKLTRSPVVIIISGLMMISLLLVVVSAVTVAWQVSLRGRKTEFNMMTWMAALLFVIPTVRNGLPGSPPFGAVVDVAVFFWLHAFAVAALLSVVVTWSRNKG